MAPAAGGGRRTPVRGRTEDGQRRRAWAALRPLLSTMAASRGTGGEGEGRGALIGRGSRKGGGRATEGLRSRAGVVAVVGCRRAGLGAGLGWLGFGVVAGWAGPWPNSAAPKLFFFSFFL